MAAKTALLDMFATYKSKIESLEQTVSTLSGTVELLVQRLKTVEEGTKKVLGGKRKKAAPKDAGVKVKKTGGVHGYNMYCKEAFTHYRLELVQKWDALSESEKDALAQRIVEGGGKPTPKKQMALFKKDEDLTLGNECTRAKKQWDLLADVQKQVYHKMAVAEKAKRGADNKKPVAGEVEDVDEPVEDVEDVDEPVEDVDEPVDVVEDVDEPVDDVEDVGEADPQ